jgi:hypothetical protein
MKAYKMDSNTQGVKHKLQNNQQKIAHKELGKKHKTD